MEESWPDDDILIVGENDDDLKSAALASTRNTEVKQEAARTENRAGKASLERKNKDTAGIRRKVVEEQASSRRTKHARLPVQQRRKSSKQVSTHIE